MWYPGMTIKDLEGSKEWVRVSIIGGREARQLMGGHEAKVMVDKGLDAESIGVKVH